MFFRFAGTILVQLDTFCENCEPEISETPRHWSQRLLAVLKRLWYRSATAEIHAQVCDRPASHRESCKLLPSKTEIHRWIQLPCRLGTHYTRLKLPETACIDSTVERNHDTRAILRDTHLATDTHHTAHNYKQASRHIFKISLPSLFTNKSNAGS